MHFLAAAILTLATAANALKIPSFAPPDFPVSDIDNDGVGSRADYSSILPSNTADAS